MGGTEAEAELVRGTGLTPSGELSERLPEEKEVRTEVGV